MVIRNTVGSDIAKDMPVELGGSGDQVTPGWLFRAGVASCAATSITLAARGEGIELTALEVEVGSRSNARGLLGMSGARMGGSRSCGTVRRGVARHRRCEQIKPQG